MTFKTRFTTAIATGAVLLNALAPVAFAEDLTVTGNGAFSENEVKIETENTTKVSQENDAKVTNDISSNASTGGNSSSFNTGGQNKIVTGDAVTKVDVSTAVNLNKAELEDCWSCDGGDLDVKISGNGAFSENDVDVEKENVTKVSQENDARIHNYVDADANTGKNDSSFNTGGDTVIVTGEATTVVDVQNKANANIAKIGGGHGHHGGSSVEISGNGAFSENDADLDLDSAIILDQYNKAKIENEIDAESNTGKNDAGFNTGGETAIVTGDAKTGVAVDNLVNFNSANVDCDCVLEDLEVKISGNGAESKNDVEVDAENKLLDFQDNYAKLYNDVYGNSKTGHNDVSFSTGDVDGDPLIATGDAASITEVSNNGNVNLFNEGHSLHLPGDWEVNAHFDLHGLLSFLHLG
jgi:hypothetical protein